MVLKFTVVLSLHAYTFVVLSIFVVRLINIEYCACMKSFTLLKLHSSTRITVNNELDF